MTKWHVIVTEAEYEPWWFFEEWEDTIVETYDFQDKKAALAKYHSVATEWQTTYKKFAVKKEVLLAAWNPDDIVYCEDCEDDIQNFHGLILLEENQVYKPSEEEKRIYLQYKTKKI